LYNTPTVVETQAASGIAPRLGRYTTESRRLGVLVLGRRAVGIDEEVLVTVIERAQGHVSTLASAVSAHERAIPTVVPRNGIGNGSRCGAASSAGGCR